MSQENVEVVRRGNASFNGGDYGGLAENLHPDVEFRDFAHAADAPETIKGVESLLSRWTGSGKASDAAVDTLQVDVYELHEGKIVGATLGYPDKAKALEALGLAE